MNAVHRGLLWITCLILGASFFYGIRSIPLRDYRETTYAEIGREILELQSYLVPHLNGTPHLDKPPLVPWLVALSLWIFGPGEAAARLPSILSVLWTTLAVGWITRRCFGKGGGALGALLFLGLPAMHHYGRMLMTDTVFMACTTTALAAFMEGFAGGHRGWYRFGFLACGLGVLCRGVIGAAYPLGTLLLFLLAMGIREWKRVPWLTGLLLMFAVAVPWFALMEIKFPGFLNLFIVKHHVDRLLPTGSHPFVAVARWQILLGFLGFLGPLAFLLPWAVAGARGRRSTHHCLWLMALLVLASVLLSYGRNHPYTFPALPPLCALVAGWLWRLEPEATPLSDRITAVLVGLLALAVAATLPPMGPILGSISPLLAGASVRDPARVCMGLVALLALIGALFFWRRRRIEACTALALMMVPTAYMLVQIGLATAPATSRASLARIVAAEVPGQWPLVIADPGDHLFEGVGGWGFYAHRRVWMVAFKYPVTGPFQAVERPEWIHDMKDLVVLWGSGRPMALAATPEGRERLPIGPLPEPRARDTRFGLWILPQRPPSGT